MFTALKSTLFARVRPTFELAVRFATKKAGGSSRNGRKAKHKRLGVKKFGGQEVRAGNIIIRQNGSNCRGLESDNVGTGRNWTLWSLIDGIVQFYYVKYRTKKYGHWVTNKHVKVLPYEEFYQLHPKHPPSKLWLETLDESKQAEVIATWRSHATEHTSMTRPSPHAPPKQPHLPPQPMSTQAMLATQAAATAA